MTTATATVLDVIYADDGVYLVSAHCEGCNHTVLHGAGRDPSALNLGHRSAHCGCEGYEIVDSNGVVPARVIAILAGLADRNARREAARSARAAA